MRYRRLEVVTLITTFVLLLIGGSVHATGSSLACPDWPLCFGEVFPAMIGGVLFEHGHRLLASAVGVLTLIIAVSRWRRRKADPRGMRIGLLLLAMVTAQAALGGITVLLRLPLLVSMSHLALSQLFFALLTWEVCRAPARGPTPAAHRRLLVAAAVVFAQILIGGLVRHTGAGLACGSEFPTCNGSLLPAFWPDGLHTFHRLLGLSLVGIVPWACAPLRAARPFLSGTLLWLLVVQIGLGVASVLWLLPPLVVTLHLGAASMLLAVLVALAAGEASAVVASEQGRAGDSIPAF